MAVRKSKDKIAASFVIKDAGTMTAKGRRQIARWLRHQAKMLEHDGEHYATRFTARYFYR